MADLEPLDPEYVQSVLSRPPFVSIPGVHNVRDLGGCPASSSNSSGSKNEMKGLDFNHANGTGSQKFVTRSGYMFRSAEMSGITEQGVPTFN